MKRISRQWVVVLGDGLCKAIAAQGDTAKTFAARLPISYVALLRIMRGNPTHPPTAKSIINELNRSGADFTISALFAVEGTKEAIPS